MMFSLRRAGVTSGDVLLVVAGLALLAAAAYPRAARAFLGREVAAAQADVETVSGAAAAYRAQAGGWPAPTEAGEVPEELAPHLPPGFSFRSGPYTLEWGRWEALGSVAPRPAEPPPGSPDALEPPQADSAAPPPPVQGLGALTVHADDERILAALLERFGPGRSFVRERSWTLVLPPGERE